jgi:hypothetical protein
MKRPNKEMIQKALDLVIQAEAAWKSAWDGGIPAGRADTEGISSGLSTVRELLQHISRHTLPS